jgi:hypothetical protein
VALLVEDNLNAARVRNLSTACNKILIDGPRAASLFSTRGFGTGGEVVEGGAQNDTTKVKNASSSFALNLLVIIPSLNLRSINLPFFLVVRQKRRILTATNQTHLPMMVHVR